MDLDLSVLILLIVGFVLVVGSSIALTTFGKKSPALVLSGMFIAFGAYITIILVRIGIVDLSGFFSSS